MTTQPIRKANDSVLVGLFGVPTLLGAFLFGMLGLVLATKSDVAALLAFVVAAILWSSVYVVCAIRGAILR